MGGGTVMRAAAKVATAGVVNHGMRGGLPAAPAAEHAVRQASRPFTAMFSASDVAPAAVERNSWEMVDDWDFVSEVDARSKADPKPRVVFGPPPTLEETKSATCDLKEAIEKVYHNEGSLGTGLMSVVPMPNDESSMTKSFVHQEVVVPVSNHAIKAFNLLSENPAAQSVVASIAADQNVWNAVLHNEAFLDYLQTCKNPAPAFDQNSYEAADSEIPDLSSTNKSHVAEEGTQEIFRDGLKVFLDNVRLTVADMVRNVGDFFQNMFGPSAANDDDKNSNSLPLDKTLGASFMALAMMVIAVVMMKRV